MKIIFEKKPTKHGVELFWNITTAFFATLLMILSTVWMSKESTVTTSEFNQMLNNFRIATLTFVALLTLLVFVKILFVTIKGFKANAITIMRLIMQILAILNLVMVIIPLAGESWNYYSGRGLGQMSIIYLVQVFVFSSVSLALTLKLPKESK